MATDLSDEALLGPVMNAAQCVRLEDSEGRLLTYATLPAAVPASWLLEWNGRRFRSWGQFRIGGDARCDLYRETRDQPIDRHMLRQVEDPNTPRKTP